MSTVPYTLESTTHSELVSMASADAFVAQGSEPVKKVISSGIQLSPTTSGRQVDESRGRIDFNIPGILITYRGATWPFQAGQNCQDDAQHEIVIQIIDDVSHSRSQPSQTYHHWMSLIRKRLQANPYRSVLPATTADIYLIHVVQFSPASETDFHKHNQLRTGISVKAFAREMRT